MDQEGWRRVPGYERAPVTGISYQIIGKRADVWPVAAMLSRKLPEPCAISVALEPSENAGAAAIPVSEPILAEMGIGVRDLADAGARFALGYSLENFANDNASVIVAPSGDLPAIAGLPFNQILHRVVEQAKALDRFAEVYAGFRLCARAAAQGLVALPDDAPDSPLAMLGPLAVIERERLANLFEGLVPVGRVGFDTDASADFTIDLRPCERSEEATTLPWLAGRHIVADLTSAPLPLYRSLPAGGSDAFALAEPWQTNRIRLGPASARIGPLFCADTRLFLRQVAHLMECLPAGKEAPAEARRFNRLHSQAVQRLYEFCAAPIVLGRAEGGEGDIPEGLTLRIQQFRSRGGMPELEADLVDRQTWIDLLVSFGIVPQRHDRRADSFDPRQLDRALGAIRGDLEKALANMPSQNVFMQRFE